MGASALKSIRRILLAGLMIGFVSGQIGRIPLTAGVAVTPADLFALLYVAAGIPTIVTTYRRRVLHKPLTGLFVAAAISWITAAGLYPVSEFVTGLAYAARFFMYTALYFALDDDGTLFVSRFMPIAGIVFAGIGILQYAMYPSLRNLEYLGWDPHFRRLFSTVFDPNFAGILLLLTAVSAAEHPRWGTVKRYMAAAVAGIALVLTVSRSSYLAAVAAAVVPIVSRRNPKLFVALAAVVAVVLVATSSANQSYSVFRVRTAVARIGSWRDAMAIIAARPLTGHGFNMLRSVQEPGFSSENPWTASHAAAGVDNSFLFCIATMGVPGALAALWFSAAAVRFGLRTPGRTGLSVLMAFTAIAVHSQFINSLFYPWVWVWLLAVVRNAETLRRTEA